MLIILISLVHLLLFISDRSGFRINKINYYDLVNGMREYRGDNYKELIPEIMSIMNITIIFIMNLRIDVITIVLDLQ